MAEDLKKMYRTVMDDHFPSRISISFDDQTLVYQKKSWKITDEKSGELIEKGLRYGENPGQEAALYELVNGNLVLGDCPDLGGCVWVWGNPSRNPIINRRLCVERVKRI